MVGEHNQWSVGAWPGAGRCVLWGCLGRGYSGNASWGRVLGGREANEVLGVSREREAKPMGFGGVSGRSPRSMGAGGGVR